MTLSARGAIVVDEDSKGRKGRLLLFATRPFSLLCVHEATIDYYYEQESTFARYRLRLYGKRRAPTRSDCIISLNAAFRSQALPIRPTEPS